MNNEEWCHYSGMPSPKAYMKKHDNMIQWQGYEWLTQERWGNYHPGKPIVWYDPSQVIIDDGLLRLGCQYNPKTIDDITIPFGVGLISCTEKFEYGTFEIEAKLPQGQPYAWPAFWMWAFESWPPEIDVFEAYSNKRGSYFNFNIEALWGRFWRCATNVHLGQEPDNYSTGAENHWMGWKDPSNRFIKYKLEWFEDKIAIYFDGRLVRDITDESILSQLRGKTMNVILNNSIQKEYDDKISQYFFEIKSFTYKPKRR